MILGSDLEMKERAEKPDRFIGAGGEEARKATLTATMTQLTQAKVKEGYF